MPNVDQKAIDKHSRFSQPLFLIGFFRSGTSLLHAVLNQHPQIALMYECHAWDFPAFLSKRRFRHNWLERLEFLNQTLSRHRLIFGDSQRGFEKVHTPEDLYRTFAEDKSPGFWGEKAPAYCTRLLELHRRYPDCSFVVILRDPLEIFRSVVRAGQKARFFARFGTLSRFIFCQEQMIQQAAQISRSGGRVYCVSYDDLVDRPKDTCVGICRFLEIEFDQRMLDLTTADFSAVFPAKAQHHRHLQRGVIKRQEFAEEILPPAVAAKLGRFRSRWNGLLLGWSGIQGTNHSAGGPSRWERLRHQLSGRFFYLLDNGVRVLFEFLPLHWLRSYRILKEIILRRQAEQQVPFRQNLSTHGGTIVSSYVLLALVGLLDHYTGPNVTMGPFYLLPSAILTWVVGRRWGIIAAAAAVLCWSAIQSRELMGSLGVAVDAWNAAMRFLILLTVVLLLDRVRKETRAARKVDTWSGIYSSEPASKTPADTRS